MFDLSIIVVNYNGAKFLQACLNSICRQTSQAKFEIIFVDNNSTDNSVELVKAEFPQVRIIENRRNFGFSQGNNAGLNVYQGRYALLLNNDTIVKDGALDRLVEFMDTHPEAGACGPKILNPDGTLQHQGGMLAKKFWLSAEPLAVDYVIGACLLVRREVVEKVGGLDEHFFFSNDDLDWCRRIRRAGWSIFFVPQAEIVHYGGYTTKQFNQNTFVEGFRGGLYFCQKHYGWLSYQLYRVLLAISMLIAVFFCLLLYPFLKHKQKLVAYLRILMICLTGNIISNPYSLSPRILLVSNGHAEDLAAAAIGVEIKTILPAAQLKALPLVGLGKAYDNKGIDNLGLKKLLPSGGFAKEGAWHFWRDVWAGFFGLFFGHIQLLRRLRSQTDLIVGVGDAYLVALCGLFARKPLIFVDGPKSVKIAGYWPIEVLLMREFCRAIVVQDQPTADWLKKHGLPAHYLGTWVMDYVPVTNDDFSIPKEQFVIGILPGTREEAYDNLGLILDVLQEIQEDYVGLIASTLTEEKLKQKGLLRRIKDFLKPIRLIAGKFGDVCLRSDLIIGLAGIANEQAAGFGKPVVCFPGTGAQTTLRRWQEIKKITGDSMIILTGNAREKAGRIAALMRNPAEMEKMGRLGKASKPHWGGVKKIATLAASAVNS